MHISLYLLASSVALLIGCGEPKISQECSMNGYGRGSCTFTNTGSAAGAVCGHIVVDRRTSPIEIDFKKTKTDAEIKTFVEKQVFQQLGFANSSLFCSGEVATKESKQVSFGVSLVDELCDGTGPWNENCSFVFLLEPEFDEFVKQKRELLEAASENVRRK